MNCRRARKLAHEYLDHELPRTAEAEIEEHLGQCSRCRQHYQGFRFLQEALKVKAPLPEASTQVVWRNIRRETAGGWAWRLSRARERARDYFRDLEPGVIWARLGAIPVTLALILLFLAQMGEFQHSAFPVLRATQEASLDAPMVSVIDGRQTAESTERFVREVEQVPGEHYAAFVTAIRPDGSTEIEDILEYPSSQKLMDALDDYNKSTRFSMEIGGQRRIIQLHAKIEVVEGEARRGM